MKNGKNGNWQDSQTCTKLKVRVCAKLKVVEIKSACEHSKFNWANVKYALNLIVEHKRQIYVTL